MFYTCAYLKLEGEKRQGKRSKTNFIVWVSQLVKTKDGHKDRYVKDRTDNDCHNGCDGWFYCDEYYPADFQDVVGRSR